MRLARLAVAGLLAGVAAGFVVALLRPARPAPTGPTPGVPGLPGGTDGLTPAALDLRGPLVHPAPHGPVVR